MKLVLTGVLFSMLGASAPTLEVASVRVHPEPIRVVSLKRSGPSVTVEAYGLLGLLSYAYDLKLYQVTGLPDWGNSIRYDITAKAEGEQAISEAAAQQLMQQVLAERFQLKTHRATKEMPVYLLTVSKGGSRLKPSGPDEKFSGTVDGDRTARIQMTASSTERIAQQLAYSAGVNRPVLDKTGLTGLYNYTLEYTLDYGGPRSDPDSPSIFTAVEEQLGLKLEAAKAPIELLVVDHVERPSEN